MSNEYRRRLTPEEFNAFLGRHNSTVMATMNPDGSPHMTPVGYDYHDGVFSVSTTRDRVKYRNVAADSRVSLLIRGLLEEGGGEAVVVVSGSGQLSEDREEAVAMLRRLLDKSYPKDVADRLYEDRKDEARVVISLRPEKTITWLQIGRAAVS